MACVVFAPAIQRHVATPAHDVHADSVGAALHMVFELQPELRGYILTDQGRLRPHLAIFVDGVAVRDRKFLADPIRSESQIYVVQALSGG